MIGFSFGAALGGAIALSAVIGFAYATVYSIKVLIDNERRARR